MVFLQLHVLTLYLVAVNPAEPNTMKLSIGSSSVVIDRSAPVLAASPCSAP